MKKRFFLLLAFLILLPGQRILASDVHATIETNITYMDYTRTFLTEHWLTADKQYTKRNDLIWITRKDLGLIWRIDLEEKTYTEVKIQETRKRDGTEKKDVHTLGWDYELLYDWTIRDTGKSENINGFPCRLFTASGDSDFSEITIDFWIFSERSEEAGNVYRAFILEQLKGDTELEPIYTALKKHRYSFLVLRRETIENPISPTRNKEVRLSKLERGDPPPKIYDLPEGLKKVTE